MATNSLQAESACANPVEVEIPPEPWTRAGMKLLATRASALEDVLRYTQATLQAISDAGCFHFLPSDKGEHARHEAGVGLLDMLSISVRSAAADAGDDLCFDLMTVADKLAE